MIEYDELRDPLERIALSAGRVILDIYDAPETIEITRKDDRSPLTAADLAANEVISAGLEDLTPDIPILSEESATVDYDIRRTWSSYWLVDPLDGTREFIKHNGEFTVNIALIENHRPVLSVVYAPVKQLLYSALAGYGAYRSEGDKPAQRIGISDRQSESGIVRVVGSRSHAGDSLVAFLEKIGEHELLSIGSSLKLCLVAEGSADLYPRLGPTSEWDTAAAQCIVEQAGGAVLTLSGQPLMYNQKESLLNPHFMVIGDRSIDWLSALS